MRTSLLLGSMALAVTLTGCMSVSYSPIKMDSPRPDEKSVELCELKTPDIRLAPLPTRMPAQATENDKGGVKVPAATFFLAKGKRCVFPVRAEKRVTLTPILTSSGETYRITVPRNQVWYDRDQRNVAPQGEKGSTLMNLAKSWKRHEDMGWFALVATNIATDHSKSDNLVDVGLTQDLKVVNPGQLAFYPNDAIAPVASDFFYSNNTGQIWVQIENCAAQCKTEASKAN